MSRAEEIANSVSHGLGLLAAVVWAPILILGAIDKGEVGFLIGSCVFATTSILLYLMSTLYHGLRVGRTKKVFRILDHAAIYLLIAGTYTPFTLGVLQGTWGWVLLGLVWSLATAGIVLKATGALWNPRWSTLLYLAMGWLVLIAAKPLSDQLPKWGLLWLLAGGLAYTLGVVSFTATRIRYSHLVWHLFVMIGTGCHTVAVHFYAA
jgi:hemolysin III